MDNRAHLWGIVAAAIGGTAAIAVMEMYAARGALPLMTIPFATSIVLVMGSPEAEAAQPRPLVGGHLLAALVGLVVVKLFGPGHWPAALAVGLTMVVMQLTRTFHPPAGIDPLVIVVHDMSWDFFVVPVAVGALALAGFAFVWHNTVSRIAWPVRWW